MFQALNVREPLLRIFGQATLRDVVQVLGKFGVMATKGSYRLINVSCQRLNNPVSYEGWFTCREKPNQRAQAVNITTRIEFLLPDACSGDM